MSGIVCVMYGYGMGWGGTKHAYDLNDEYKIFE